VKKINFGELMVNQKPIKSEGKCGKPKIKNLQIIDLQVNDTY